MITWLSNPDLLAILEIQLSPHDYNSLIVLLKKEKQKEAFHWHNRSDEEQQLQQLKDKAHQALKDWQRQSMGYIHQEF
jgi:hypothetical protein